MKKEKKHIPLAAQHTKNSTWLRLHFLDYPILTAESVKFNDSFNGLLHYLEARLQTRLPHHGEFYEELRLGKKTNISSSKNSP